MIKIVKFIGGFATEKKIISRLVISVGIFCCISTLRRLENFLSRTGKYFWISARSRGRIFNFYLNIFIRRGLQYGFGDKGLAHAEIIPQI